MGNRPVVVAQACDPSTWDAETKGSGVQGQPQLPVRSKRSVVHEILKKKKRALGARQGSDRGSVLGKLWLHSTGLNSILRTHTKCQA